jgi:hypothetical protein
VLAPRSIALDGEGARFGVGFAVFDRTGTAVASGQERKIYSANSDVPVRYELTIPVQPGSYRVRLAAIDLEGNSGSVEREVEAVSMEGQAFAFGDLLLGTAREIKAADLRPPVILKVTDGLLGTYTELYTDKPGTLDATDVVSEVADTADGPTLQTGVAQLRERATARFARRSASCQSARCPAATWRGSSLRRPAKPLASSHDLLR